ncbi:MAG TPA: AMP-binding protein, partial [Rhodopila sp.]
MEPGNAVDWFVDRHSRDGNGGRMAFRDPWRSLTYSDLADQTARFAGALLHAGIGRERRVVLLLLDTIDFPIAFWGAMRAGVVPVPINTLLTPETVAYILADSRADAVVISAPLIENLSAAIRAAGVRRIIVSQPDGSPWRADQAFPAGSTGLGDTALPPDEPCRGLAEFLTAGDPATATQPASPDEVAFWLYSSGSTGAPKGVRHIHSSLRFTADTYGAEVLGIGRDDVMFSAAKAFHAYGLGNSLTFPLSAGASSVLLPDRPTPDAVLGMMRTHNPTLFGGVPTLYAGLLANPYIMPGAGSTRLRRCISAGEALP